MIAKVKDKTTAQKLSWNTKLEVASRNLIIFTTTTILLMSFFVAAGSAKSYNQFYNLIGDQNHELFKFNYIIGGVIALVISLIVSAFTVFPYMFMKRPERIKLYIFISIFFLSLYTIGCFAIMIVFVQNYGYSNSFMTASYVVISLGFIIIVSAKILLWREIKKQWKIRKSFEYLTEEKKFQFLEEKQTMLIEERDMIMTTSIEDEDVEQYTIDNINDIHGDVIKKKHLSRVWRRRARDKENK